MSRLRIVIPAEELRARLARLDPIGEWETVTGLKFPYPRFHAVLAESIRPSATSLLAEKVVFSAGPVDKIAEFIIHEIGTHIIWQAELLRDERVRKIVMTDLNSFVRVIEAACQALRAPILEKAGLAQQVDIISDSELNLEKEFREFNKAWKSG